MAKNYFRNQGAGILLMAEKALFDKANFNFSDMTGNCNYKPEGLIPYGNTGTGQVLFLIERNDKTDQDGNVVENWDYRSAFVGKFDRENIISAVIREKYSQDQVESIFANYLAGDDNGEYTDFQRWRQVAKAVAEGKHLKSELSSQLSAQVGDVVESIVTVLNEKGLIP